MYFFAALLIITPFLFIYQYYKDQASFNDFDKSNYIVIVKRITDFEIEKKFCGKQRCDNYYAKVDFFQENQIYSMRATITRFDYEKKEFLSQHPQTLVLYYSPYVYIALSQNGLNNWKAKLNNEWTVTKLTTLFFISLIIMVIWSNASDSKKKAED